MKIGGMGSGNIILSSHLLDGNPPKDFYVLPVCCGWLSDESCIRSQNIIKEEKGANPVDFCTDLNFKKEYIFFILYP